MNRELRNLLWLCFGLLLGGFVVLESARADTIPATKSTTPVPATVVGWSFIGKTFSTIDAACNAYAAMYGATVKVVKCEPYMSGGIPVAITYEFSNGQKGADGVPIFNCPSGSLDGSGRCDGAYVCPTGQNWTLNGQTCERPDCPTGRNADGTCKSCTKTETHNWYARKIADGANGSNTGTYCEAGCVVEIALELDADTEKNGIPYYENDTTVWQYLLKTTTGDTCTPSSGTGTGVPPSPTSNPGADSKTTPCASGEGVLSGSNGKLYCVPQNVQPSETPKQSKEVSTKNYPDGSKTEITTWNTCNGAGACQTITQTTISNASNGQPGQAGQPGTTISNSSKNPSGTGGASGSGQGGSSGKDDVKSDFCMQNPKLQICQNNIATEATAKATLEEVKKISTVDPGTSLQGIKDGGQLVSAQVSAKTTEQDDEIAKWVEGNKTNPDTEAKKSAWAQVMNAGWLEPINPSSCADPSIQTRSMPISAKFEGWCSKAAQISEVGSYGMWIWLLFTVFGMLTGGSSAKGG